jgi:hypothetical protein
MACLASGDLAVSGIGDQNFPAIRFRIEAVIRQNGPMTTSEVLLALRNAFAEGAIRTALRFLEDDGRLTRPSQKQRWEIA